VKLQVAIVNMAVQLFAQLQHVKAHALAPADIHVNMVARIMVAKA
jgi:hypothetical protein